MNDIFVYIEHFQNIVADISYICLAQAQQIAKLMNVKVVAVLLGKNTDQLSEKLLANEVITVNHDDLSEFTYETYITVLTNLLKDKNPGLILFGDTTIGSDLAGGLSVRLNLPVVSFCKEIKFEENKLRFISQICDGKVYVEGNLPNTGALVTMLPGKFKAIEGHSSTSPKVISYPVPEFPKSSISIKEILMPSDEGPDISKEKILIAIGRGIENEDNISLVEELTDAMGGVLCASRPVIDHGWLPSTRLVGKSGKTVKPKLFLALGISGAPEHTEAIEESEMIIAVNTDPNAPIFNIARLWCQRRSHGYF